MARRHARATSAAPALLLAFSLALPSCCGKYRGVPHWELLDSMSTLCNLYVVQVGANCGRPGCDAGGDGGNKGSHDPVWRYAERFGWRGAVIEPSPSTFEQLRANYRNLSGVSGADMRALNVAVTNTSGILDFYCPVPAVSGAGNGSSELGKPADTAWTRARAAAKIFATEGCTTDRHWATANPFRTPFSRSRVPAVTLEALWAQLKPSRVDILAIDAEGADHLVAPPGLTQCTHSPLHMRIVHSVFSPWRARCVVQVLQPPLPLPLPTCVTRALTHPPLRMRALVSLWHCGMHALCVHCNVNCASCVPSRYVFWETSALLNPHFYKHGVSLYSATAARLRAQGYERVPTGLTQCP